MSSSALPAEAGRLHSRERIDLRWRRRCQKTLIFGFLIALGAPNLDLVFHLDPNPSPLRDTGTFPTLRFDASLARFPGQFSNYLKTNMGFRGTLVRARALIAWHALGVSPTPGQVERSDPWLFLRGERVFDDFRRVDPFSPAQLERWRSVLEARRAWLAERKIRYLVVIPPNKETVYAEAVPPWFTRARGPSRLRQLEEALRGAGRVEFINLTDELAAHKDEGRLYYLTDTHWNDRGAFVGYQAIVGRLRAWYPELHPFGIDDLTRVVRLTPGGDLARNCGLKADLPELQEQLDAPASSLPTFADGSPLTSERMDVVGRPWFSTRGPGGEIPSAMILRDSFGEALVPYLARHFQAATWHWTYEFPASVIETLKPSLLIEEMVERKLMGVEPQNPPTVAALENRTAQSE